MNQRNDSQIRLWIRDRDSLGNSVDLRLIEAAHRVWERARLVVIRYLAEDTEAPEILEAAVDSASRAMGSHQSIQFFEAYLLRCVARESVRRLRKNKRVEYLGNSDLERLAGAVSGDLDRQLDDTKQSRSFAPVWTSRDAQCTICESWISIGDQSPSSRGMPMPTALRYSSARSFREPWIDSGLIMVHV